MKRLELLVQALTPIATIVVAWVEGLFDRDLENRIDELERRIEALESKK